MTPVFCKNTVRFLSRFDHALGVFESPAMRFEGPGPVLLSLEDVEAFRRQVMAANGIKHLIFKPIERDRPED